MPKPRVYVETTIPSAYHTDRNDPNMVGKRLVTRRWWNAAHSSCELVTSTAVWQEILDGRSAHVPARLRLLEGLELLRTNAAVAETVLLYIHAKLMPADPLGDALHLALASHHKCDVLVTWNYRHLANGTKLDRIRRFNVQLGLFVPTILTPRDIMDGDEWPTGL